MRPVSACAAASCSGPSASSLGIGAASTAAAACCARALPAPAAAASSRRPQCLCLGSGTATAGQRGAASARPHHRSALLVAAAVTGAGADGGTASGSAGSSGGGGRLTRGRTPRTTIAAPSQDAAEAAPRAQGEAPGPPQRRLRRKTEAQVAEPEAAAGGSAAAAPSSPSGGSSSAGYAAWKVSELQDALSARGLPRTGRKAELVERLAAAAAATAPAAAGVAATSVAPATVGASAAAAPAVAAAAAAPQRRSRLTLTRATATATPDVESGRDAQGRSASSSGRAAAAAAATERAPAAAGAGDEEGDGGGGFLDALFDTLTLDITVKEQRPGRRPTAASSSAPGRAEPAAGRPAPPARAAAAAGRGTDSLDSVDFDLDAEGGAGPTSQPTAAEVAAPVRGADRRADAEHAPQRQPLVRARAAAPSAPAAVPAAAPADAAAAAAAAGEGRQRRLAIRRERPTEAEDDRSPAAAAAAAVASPAPPVSAPDGGEEGVRERRGREPRERPPPVGPAPDLTDLPPWPPQFLGRLRRVDEIAPGDIEQQESALLGNVHGLSLTCLGSAPCLATRAAAAGSPGEDRALGSLALARGKDIFIFDVGDDTQRQVGQAYHVKPSKIFRIFLTSLAPEAVLGLPGLMCTINASRERGHELADIPVHVYGPPGTAAFLVSMMRVSQTYLEVTVVVHEFSLGHVSAAELAPIVGGGGGGGGGGGPLAADKNRRISRLALPPDQLNPRGAVDASLLTFAPEQGRGQKRKGRNASGGVLSFDPRAGYLPWPEPQPGDPDRRAPPDPLSLTWTLELDVSGRVVACLLPAAPGQPGAFGGGGGEVPYVLAYTVIEADRSGALVMERAAAAGLEGGPEFARLKQGETISNPWGQAIPPELVISPTRAGRRVVIAGNAADLRPLAAHGHTRGADILVPGAVWLQGETKAAAEHGGCTTAAVGAAAAALGVRYVVLSRFSGPSATADHGADEEAEDELPMDVHTRRLVAEVEAAAAAAARGGADASSGGTEAASASRRRSVRKTATAAGAAAVKGASAGAAVAGDRLRRVLLLRDLDAALMEKNEGPLEPQEEGGAFT
ncbi:hypothetical protein HXX76_008928 [Chlamydomonas incerta]|uniref:SAP domain-containing protein n=1 Tax=Chlamydomonas incerta TaxID=51695 RepID=A0A835W0K4_CHLIN|nr:hypothetical protein HXX76_008928 [Chlamydomonas incerta]|eukprot:KAG2432584.1 hypothetical protein HXX76_008928 [Chlamydomonas incerta]